jgi:hypothetical protein
VGVPKAGALLVIAIDLADEAVHVDNETLIAGTGACHPRTSQAVCQHPVELADMPKRERPQKRPCALTGARRVGRAVARPVRAGRCCRG